jgi:hypothetical protein
MLNDTTKPNALSTLLGWAASKTRRSADRVSFEASRGTLDHSIGWAEFLPDDLYELWPELSLDARIVAFVFAFCAYRDFDGTKSFL